MVQQKLAIVTGGNRGLGLATVKQLCQSGVRTLFTSRNPHDGQNILFELREHSSLLDYHPLDVSDNGSVADLGEYLKNKFGYLDILINNSGVNYDTWQRASKVAMAEVEYTLQVNLLGAWRMCNMAIPYMLGQEDARIINVSSGAGKISAQDGTTPAYSLSKNALNMLTKSLAADLGDTSISVNAVDPGWTRTAMGGEQAPLTPEAGADTAVWLATRQGESLTGGFYHQRKRVEW